jgi:hypothetical protein
MLSAKSFARKGQSLSGRVKSGLWRSSGEMSALALNNRRAFTTKS